MKMEKEGAYAVYTPQENGKSLCSVLAFFETFSFVNKLSIVSKALYILGKL